MGSTASLHRLICVDGAEGAQDVAIRQRHVAVDGEAQLADAQTAAVVESFQGQSAAIGHSRKSPCHCDQVGHLLTGLDLEHGWMIDTSDKRYLGPHGADMHHVAGLNQVIGRTISS